MVVYKTEYIELVASSIIGIIQLYLGWHIAKKNIGSLVGEEGVEMQTIQRIFQLIKSNPFIKEVKDVINKINNSIICGEN